MKKNNIFTLISSIFSLVITLNLFVVCIYAWYVSNKEVRASLISGSVKNDNLIQDVTYYTVKDKVVSDNVSYTIDKSSSSVLDLKEFNIIDNTITDYLIRIRLNSLCDISYITAKTNTKYFLGFDNIDNPGYIKSSSNLNLSSVVKFSYVSASISNDIITCDSFSYRNFSFTNGKIDDFSVELIDNSIEANELWIVVDYNVDNLDLFYSNNIGNSIFENASRISYNFDFVFQIGGKSK